MDELQTSTSGVAEAIAFGATLADPKHASIGVNDQRPYVLLPPDYSVHDLEHTLANPTRIRAAVALAQTKSFIDYFVELKTESSRIYGTTEPPRFIAVLDDNLVGKPGWREHTASYNCPLSKEWEIWTACNKRQMKQPDFAQFIEDNLPDIISPEAAHMLEVSRTLEAKKNVNFASGVRLDNGEVQFTYEEKIEGSAGKGQFRVPETFVIGIPVFHGGPRYRVDARFRYRIAEGGHLTLWFDLVRPHKIIEDAALEVWGVIEEGTGVTIRQGTPK